MGLFSNNKREIELEQEIETLKKLLNTKTSDATRYSQELISVQLTISDLKTKIKDLTDEINKKNAELLSIKEINQNLKNELLKVKSNSISGKQVEIIERNLKQNKSTINTMKEVMDSYGISFSDKERKIYKVPIKDFFPGTKFDDIIEKLESDNIFYVQEINIHNFKTNFVIYKNFAEASKKLDFFYKKRMSAEVSLLLNRGEKIKKIYAKSRKFIDYCNNNYLEFMDDLQDFDFDSLKTVNFENDVITTLKDIKNKYFLEMCIK